MVSVHWGSNWGYDVPAAHVRFAHRLIDGGVDVVYGHSSHHPRPIEVYRRRIILYGCGDFVNDYEGIGGHEEYRGDLVLMYLLTVHPGTREPARLTMVPFQATRLRLQRTSRADSAWLRDRLTRASAPFGTSLALEREGELTALPS